MNKKCEVINCMDVFSNGQQTVRKRGLAPLHYFDSTPTTATVTTTPAVVSLFAPAQGTAATQRTTDTVYLDKMYLNYLVSMTNADFYSSIRMIIFQWIPNNTLIVPTAFEILQTVVNNVYSFYDWQYSNQYRILYDKIHFLTGSATQPTTGSSQGYLGEIDLSKALKKVEFATGATTASNTIYALYMSDSALAPSPAISFVARITFSNS